MDGQRHICSSASCNSLKQIIPGVCCCVYLQGKSRWRCTGNLGNGQRTHPRRSHPSMSRPHGRVFCPDRYSAQTEQRDTNREMCYQTDCLSGQQQLHSVKIRFWLWSLYRHDDAQNGNITVITKLDRAAQTAPKKQPVCTPI